jgi:hypothetical protein
MSSTQKESVEEMMRFFFIKNQEIIGNLDTQIPYRPMQSTKPRRADTDFERSGQKDQSPDHTTAV